MSEVRAGEVYRHYKGNLYLVLAVADYTGRHESKKDPSDRRAEYPRDPHTGFPEGTKLVVYVGLYDNPKGNCVCVRPLSEWSEEVAGRVTDPSSHGEGMDAMVPRYRLVVR